MDFLSDCPNYSRKSFADLLFLNRTYQVIADGRMELDKTSVLAR